MTKDEAIQMASTDWWKDSRMSPDEVFLFQISEPLLCMNFGDFQIATEKALGRPVWTHEFVNPEALVAEYKGEAKRPTFEEIVDKLPAGRRSWR